MKRKSHLSVIIAAVSAFFGAILNLHIDND